MNFAMWLVIGIACGALFVLTAYAIRSHTRQILFLGLVAAALGWLTWDIRRGAHRLVRANAVVPTGSPLS